MIKEVNQSKNQYEKEIAQFRAGKLWLEERIILARKEEIAMNVYKMKPFPVKELYDEIWTNAAGKTAKKYSVPYDKFKKACEEAGIPLPTNSYWGSLASGKDVQRTPLPDSVPDDIMLPVIDNKATQSSKKKSEMQNNAEKKTKKKSKAKPVILAEAPSLTVATAPEKGKESTPEEQEIKLDTVLVTLRRDKLYEELWSDYIVNIAKKYGLSENTIRQAYKLMDIPKPAMNYWKPFFAGQNPPKLPLPNSDVPESLTAFHSVGAISEELHEKPLLSFLSEETRVQIITVAASIQINSSKMHPAIKKNQTDINRWAKNHSRDEKRTRKRDPYYNSIPEGEPPLFRDISNETRPRVYALFNELFYAIEQLGGKVNDDFSVMILGERVTFKIYEDETQVIHVKTPDELKEIEKYEKDVRLHNWASKPQIRKYDYLFNGKLRLTVFDKQVYKDTDKNVLENQLGNILIALYEKSEVNRQERLKREERIRKEEEAKRLRDQRRELRNEEIKKVNGLCNAADDYDKACKIRAYVSAVSEKPDLGKQEKEWIDWALQKADWFDPTISREDVLLGKRNHEENSDKKELKPEYSWRG